MELIHSLLLQAITGESGAEARYQSFAVSAKKEGLRGVASLFIALSRAEAIHIANHKRALQKNGYTSEIELTLTECKGGKTSENIEEAIQAEYDEFKEMYPSFRRQIKKKYGTDFNGKIALLSIKWASESEAIHHALLKLARKSLAAGEDLTKGDFYLCSVCGNINYLNESPKDLCHICGHDISFYTLVKGS